MNEKNQKMKMRKIRNVSTELYGLLAPFRYCNLYVTALDSYLCMHHILCQTFFDVLKMQTQCGSSKHLVHLQHTFCMDCTLVNWLSIINCIQISGDVALLNGASVHSPQCDRKKLTMAMIKVQ